MLLRSIEYILDCGGPRGHHGNYPLLVPHSLDRDGHAVIAANANQHRHVCVEKCPLTMRHAATRSGDSCGSEHTAVTAAGASDDRTLES